MVDRAAIEAEILALADRKGRLTPAQVLEAARDPLSALHDEFLWDDGAAAEQFRLSQARTLIRSVHVKLRTDHRTIVIDARGLGRAPRYVRDPDAPTGTAGYRDVLKLSKEEDSAREVVVQEYARAAAALRRARNVAAVLGQEELIDNLVHQLTRLMDDAQGVSPV